MPKIDLTFEAADAAMIELLKDTYDTVTWNYFNATHPEDIQTDLDVMDAVYTLMGYYTAGDQADEILTDIFHRHYYKFLLGHMGEDVGSVED